MAVLCLVIPMAVLDPVLDPVILITADLYQAILMAFFIRSF